MDIKKNKDQRNQISFISEKVVWFVNNEINKIQFLVPLTFQKRVGYLELLNKIFACCNYMRLNVLIWTFSSSCCNKPVTICCLVVPWYFKFSTMANTTEHSNIFICWKLDCSGIRIFMFKLHQTWTCLVPLTYFRKVVIWPMKYGTIENLHQLIIAELKLYKPYAVLNTVKLTFSFSNFSQSATLFLVPRTYFEQWRWNMDLGTFENLYLWID